MDLWNISTEKQFFLDALGRFSKTAGVIQGFWSLNPEPTQSDFIKAA